MTEPSAKIILDSISPDGQRLTTIEAVFHRFVLAEFNTHRALSRNSASSRALPAVKQLNRVKNDPAWPIQWPCEQPGMQGGEPLEDRDLDDAQALFYQAHKAVTDLIDQYVEAHPEVSTRLHKSLVNRLVEPFMWHTVIVTSTDYDNFFKLRVSPLAQPEINAVAVAMQQVYLASTPTLLDYGQWHTPYIQPDEDFPVEERKRISVARCARVSYLTHAGIRDPQEDVAFFGRLMVPPGPPGQPRHESPLEHVATPCKPHDDHKGNFVGWDQLRHLPIAV